MLHLTPTTRTVMMALSTRLVGKCLYCNRDTLLRFVRASEMETHFAWPVTMIVTGVLLPFRSAFEIAASEMEEV
jgi:hypothetical protein